MFNTWLTMRQIDEALQEGRLDDAFQLANHSKVRGYHHAGDLLRTLGLAFLERARFRIKQKEMVEAWQDWQHAQELSIDPPLLAKVKGEWQAAVHAELRQGMEARQLKNVLEQLQRYRSLGLHDPDLPRWEELCKAWLAADELVQKGELALALKKLDAVDVKDVKACAAFREELLRQQMRFSEMKMSLQDALAQEQWREVIRLADQLLVIAPQNTELRRVRTAAWRELEPATLIHSPPPKRKEPPVEPAPLPEPALPRRFILWVDGSGGYLVCLDRRVSLGQGAEGNVDVPIMADISRLHAYICRDGEGYLLEAVRPVTLNKKAIEKTLLKDGDVFCLGAHCHLRFNQPVSVSNTATLKILSPHRLPLALDGIILMDETCLLGDQGEVHVKVPGMLKPLAILKKRDELWVQSARLFQIDGQEVKNRGALQLDSTITGDDFRISLEPVKGQPIAIKAPSRPRS